MIGFKGGGGFTGEMEDVSGFFLRRTGTRMRGRSREEMGGKKTVALDAVKKAYVVRNRQDLYDLSHDTRAGGGRA